MTTYWHIAWDGYQPGDDLICRRAQSAIESPWTWDEADEGFDSDVICLFPDSEKGRTEADWLWSDRPSYTLLRVEIPEGQTEVLLTTVEEGYPAAYDRIPAEWVTVIASGYREGAIQ